MGRTVYILLCAAVFAIAAYSVVPLIGYPEPPPMPADTRGGGFRVERQGQDILLLHGSPYALGRNNAKLFAPEMAAQEQTLLDLLFKFAKGPATALLMRQISLAYLVGFDSYLLPRERQEILGLADGASDPLPDLGPRYARLAAYHAVHELSQRFAFDNPLFACTLVAVGGKRSTLGHALLGRNFDFEGGDIFDQHKVVVAVRPQTGFGFVSVAWAGMAGVVSGINERGLAVVINAGASSDYNRVGAPTTLLVRRALEQASTIDEAVRVLTSAPRFVTDIIGLSEASGRVAVLELTPNHYALREGEVLFATNHLEHPAFADDPTNRARQKQTTTVPRRLRLTTIGREHTGTWGVEDILATLRDKRDAAGATLPLGHRHAIDALIASHSVIFDSTAKIVWVSAGPHTLGPYLGYDVQRLLRANTPAEVQASYVDALPAEPHSERAFALAWARYLWSATQQALDAHTPAVAAAALGKVPKSFTGHPTHLRLEGELAFAFGERERAQNFLRRALAAAPEYPRDVERIEALLGR